MTILRVFTETAGSYESRPPNATSDATATGPSAAAMIRSFSARDHPRRRCTDVITSPCVFLNSAVPRISTMTSDTLFTPSRRPTPEAYGAPRPATQALGTYSTPTLTSAPSHVRALLFADIFSTCSMVSRSAFGNSFSKIC